MNQKFFTLLTALLLSSCASSDKKHNETLAAISTVSAIAIAVPLIPFVEVYHIVNDTRGKDKERSERLAEKFDPIYIQRVEVIESRNPSDDAKALIGRDILVLLPSVPGGGIFPGLLPKQTVGFNKESNSAQIASSEFAMYLSVLMGKEPAHEAVGEYYFGDPYKKFLSTGWRYKEVFNQIMHGQIQANISSNKLSNTDAASGAGS